MRESCKRLVATESKSFDVAVVGIEEDLLEIYPIISHNLEST